jgi:AmiR/NasT family two-component response regulator
VRNPRVPHGVTCTASVCCSSRALADPLQTDRLHTALANRDIIGQAKGILMERHRITSNTAFSYLSKASQDVNMKLTSVARHLVETGELLGALRLER